MALYFMAADSVSLIKIGHAADPVSRMYSARSGSPVPLRLAAVDDSGDVLTEAELLYRLRDHRRHGEWVTACPEVLAIVSETAATGRVPGGWRLPPHIDKRFLTPGSLRVKDVFARYGLDRKQYREIMGACGQSYNDFRIPINRLPHLHAHITSLGISVHYHELLAPAAVREATP